VQKVARTPEHGAGPARALGAEVLREHFALARQRGLVTCAALVSQVGKDAAAVLLADEAGDQSLLFQPANDAGERALAEVHDVAEGLHAALELRVAGKLVEHLELADPEAVCRQRPFEGIGHPGVLLEQGVPVIDGGIGDGHDWTVASVRNYDLGNNSYCIDCICMYLGHMPSSRTSPRTSPPDIETRWSPALWAALLVLCGVVFLDALDVSMVGMALPSIQDDLGLSTGQLQWVVSGYVLGYGGLLLLGGRAADLLGRRRVLLWALAVFVIASALGGIANNGELLIAARFVKGVSAAFTAPAALSIITTTFAEGPARNRALSIFTTVGASGFSLGLVLGGLLTELGWRWTFLLPAPIAAILVVLARNYVPRDTHLRGGRGYDIPGAVTVSAAMLLLVHTVVTAPAAGWSSLSIVGGFAGTALLFAAFIVIELRSPHPLVRLGILRSSRLVRANIAVMSLLGSYIGFQFIGTLYLQSMLGWSSLHTAFAFLPAGVIVALGSTRIAPLLNRYGTPRLLVVSFSFLTAGYALFLRLGENASYLTLILPTMLLLGLGFVIGFPALNVQATNGVADDEQGLASGLVSTSGQLGAAVGLAAVSAVVTSRTGSATDAVSMLNGFRPGIAVATGIGLAGLLVSVSGWVSERRESATAEPVPDGTVDELPLAA
jgi:predicted MFS family arabinose efflux permease